MKNPNDPFGNQTRDLPACGPVHQPTASKQAEGIITAFTWNESGKPRKTESKQPVAGPPAHEIEMLSA
jgi:YD repeat-containing protein